MKKYIIIALAVITAAACTKVESTIESGREISFSVANYVHTKAEGVLYEGGNFGTYAWYNGTEEAWVNEEVGLRNSAWTTLNNTYYWPKTGFYTFVSYSPFSGSNNTANSVPAVTLNGGVLNLDYGTYTVGADDLLYADAVSCSDNLDEVTDGVDSGYNGVPTLFRHALAKVRFEICAGFLEAGTAPDVTSWEISVVKAGPTGVFTQGSLSMDWSGSEWTKPEGNVWTSPALPADSEFAEASGLALTTGFQPLGDMGFVLPQVLADQTISLDLHIKTSLPNGKTIEEDLTVAPKLTDFSADLQSWQMNQSIVYRIIINPIDSGKTPILFDPAIGDWDEVSADLTVSI